MILVDTSVWINHLRTADVHLAGLLEKNLVVCHRFVVEELALGSIAKRAEVLHHLSGLASVPELTHREHLTLAKAHRLWDRGLSAIDVHLLGSALISHSRIWTRDIRLRTAARELAVAYEPPSR